MFVNSSSSTNFRNLVDEKNHFNTGFNLLIGNNGQGKTNFLEMIYFGITSKSFRTSSNQHLVRDRKQNCLIRTELIKSGQTCLLGIEIGKGKTTRYIGEKSCRSIDFFRQGAVLAFTARSKRLIEGDPEERRRFLDRMISYFNPEYLLQLSKYKKILLQLKKILQKRSDLNLYRSFKALLNPLALAIIKRRISFLDQLRSESLTIFSSVFGEDKPFYFRYICKNINRVEDYGDRFMDRAAQELLLGKTLVGPHLDDLEIHLENNRAKFFASSGQVRAMVLSFKLAVRKVYFDHFGHFPILLLDDLDAELDVSKIDGILAYLQGFGQTLISTSKYGTIKPLRPCSLFQVQDGRIRLERNSE